MSKPAHHKETVEVDDYVVTLDYPKFTPATHEQPAEGGIQEAWISSVFDISLGEIIDSFTPDELDELRIKAIEIAQ